MSSVFQFGQADLDRVMKHVRQRHYEASCGVHGRLISTVDGGWASVSPDIAQEIIVTYLRHRQEDEQVREKTPEGIRAMALVTIARRGNKGCPREDIYGKKEVSAVLEQMIHDGVIARRYWRGTSKIAGDLRLFITQKGLEALPYMEYP